MATSSPQDVTALLLAWNRGDRAALDKLIPLVYQELHQTAKRYLKHEREDHSLQTTALVNEVYLRLVDVKQVELQNRAHFLAISAQLMRQILVDFARRRQKLKRGKGLERVTLDDALIVSSERSPDIVALDDALKTLEKLDSRQSKIVELRFFGGLSEEEIAQALQLSARTVRNDWSMAKVWLLRELDKNLQ
ncbi:MAG: sigma-70 family RNA polymerase sigma factor [Acidobacteriota bacterium]